MRSLLVPILVLAFTPPLPAGAAEVSPGSRAAQALQGLRLSFEKNRGQAGEGVRFLARGSGYALSLTDREAWLSLPQALIRTRLVGANSRPRMEGTQPLAGTSNYFLGNDPAKWLTDIPTYGGVRYHQVYPSIDLLYYGTEGQLEYDFIVAPGGDPGAIQLAFEGVRKMQLQANGDLVLEAGSQQVRWRRPVAYQLANGERRPVEGAFELRGRHRVGFRVSGYDASLPLVIDPVLSYSTYFGGIYNEVAMGIAVDSTGSVYFAGYTTSANLPVTAAGYQRVYGGHGNQYMGGDAFVAKLNPQGTARIYATYLGGSGGDLGLALAVDSQGNAYVTGVTRSTDFPTTPGAFQRTYQGTGGTVMTHGGDAFVAKLNPAGSTLVYSTYLGGSQDDEGLAIAVNSSGNAFVAGATRSTNFPVTAGAYQTTFRGEGGMPNHPHVPRPPIVVGDGFVAKLDAAGSTPTFCTYLGGTLDDGLRAIVLDPAGDIYVAGSTLSSNFPVTPGAYRTTYSGYGTPGQDIFRFGDGVIARLRSDGAALLASTFLGGSRDDVVTAIAVGPAPVPAYRGGSTLGVTLPSGDVYVAGFTSSLNFPFTAGAYQTAYRGNTSGTVNELVFGDAFVARLDSALTARVYATYLGGSLDDVAWGLAVDPSGSALVVGQTLSRDFPTTADAIQRVFGGEEGEPSIEVWGDAFVARLAPTGATLPYATYLGGTAGEGASSIALDAAGNGYVAGRSYSTNFPTTQGAYQRTMLGGDYNWGYPPGDAFVTKIGDLAQPAPTVRIDSVVNGASFLPGIAPNSFVSIFGSGFAAAATNWDTAIPDGLTLPTTLGGVQVRINSVNAYVNYVSATQLNVLAAPGAAAGSVNVEVITPQGTATTTAVMAPVAPGFFCYWIGNKQYLAALFGNTAIYVAAVGALPTASSRPAKPGDILQLYVNGLGATRTPVPAGQVLMTDYPIDDLARVSVTIGGIPATVQYAGLTFAGLFQVNVEVPPGIQAGELEVVLTVDGQPTQPNALLTFEL